jgi:hypothetical protein
MLANEGHADKDSEKCPFLRNMVLPAGRIPGKGGRPFFVTDMAAHITHNKRA